MYSCVNFGILGGLSVKSIIRVSCVPNSANDHEFTVCEITESDWEEKLAREFIYLTGPHGLPVGLGSIERPPEKWGIQGPYPRMF